MDIIQLETDVVTQLTSLLDPTLCDIMALPEDDNDYKRPMGKAKIVVAYDNSEYKEELTTLPVAQKEVVEVVITIISRTLRDAKGIYTLFGLIKAALIGFVPSNCNTPFVGKWFGTPEVGTKARVDEVWTYEFHIRTTSTLVDNMDYSGVVSAVPPITTNAQFNPPNPLPLQGLLDITVGPPPIIQIIEQ